jgi:hypothetical protein
VGTRSVPRESFDWIGAHTRDFLAGARVVIAAHGAPDLDGLAAGLREALVRAGLRDPEVQIDAAAELARTTVGKRRLFFPLR